jgi:hypothetical protein
MTTDSFSYVLPRITTDPFHVFATDYRGFFLLSQITSSSSRSVVLGQVNLRENRNEGIQKKSAGIRGEIQKDPR